MEFGFATARRIVFGRGVFAQAADMALALGSRILLVTGRRREPLREFERALQAGGAAVTHYPVTGEPDTASLEDGLERARRAGCDTVVAVGGGSVIDTGKAIAGLLRQEGEVLDFLEDNYMIRFRKTSR